MKVLLLTHVKLYSVIFIYVVCCRNKSIMLQNLLFVWFLDFVIIGWSLQAFSFCICLWLHCCIIFMIVTLYYCLLNSLINLMVAVYHKQGSIRDKYTTQCKVF
jgi:hypothetical protein